MQLATIFQISTSSEAFALSVALFHRCLTTLTLMAEQRESYELPMVCFQLAVKFADGCPPLLKDLCRCFEGIEIDARDATQLEVDILSALDWNIDMVTVTQVLKQALALSPLSLREVWRSSMGEYLDLFHDRVSTDYGAAAVASAIIAAMVVDAGLGIEVLAGWLPASLMPPLDHLNKSSVGSEETLTERQREIIEVAMLLRRPSRLCFHAGGLERMDATQHAVQGLAAPQQEVRA